MSLLIPYYSVKSRPAAPTLMPLSGFQVLPSNGAIHAYLKYMCRLIEFSWRRGKRWSVVGMHFLDATWYWYLRKRMCIWSRDAFLTIPHNYDFELFMHVLITTWFISIMAPQVTPTTNNYRGSPQSRKSFSSLAKHYKRPKCTNQALVSRVCAPWTHLSALNPWKAKGVGPGASKESCEGLCSQSPWTLERPREEIQCQRDDYRQDRSRAWVLPQNYEA